MQSTEVISKSKLKKLSKKTDRKKFKTKELLRKFGSSVKLSSCPTKHLLVSNGGLGNSVSREEILNIFRPFGLLEEVVMQEQFPHCFVTFANVESATKASQAIHGHQLVQGDSREQIVSLYLSYVDRVPEMKSVTMNASPEGLFLIENFIDEEVEKELQELVTWEETENQSTLKHRRVKHYGYEFNYDTNNVDKDCPLEGPMPRVLTDIIALIMETGHVTCRPNQVTVNQYLPGQGIPPHVDTHSAFEDAIVSLSVGSMVLMDFTHPDSTHAAEILPPRSLLVMTGEARYLWSHGITPRKSDVIQDTTSEAGGMTLVPRGIRTSFTFRAVRGRPCNCDFPEKCDSQKACNSASEDHPTAPSVPGVNKPSSEAEAIKLEQSQVHKVYNEIAPHFSSTRYKPWPQVSSFLDGLEDGAMVLDVGCGNGKYIGVNPNLYMMGCDRSSGLITICAERGHKVFVCDGLDVPVRSGIFDACLSIAVIHHFSTRSRRSDALKELARLLRPGGLALVYVWAMEQEKHNKKSKYLMKKTRGMKESAGSNTRGIESLGGNKDNTASGGDDLDLEERMRKMDFCENTCLGRDSSRLQCSTEEHEDVGMRSSDSYKETSTDTFMGPGPDNCIGASESSDNCMCNSENQGGLLTIDGNPRDTGPSSTNDTGTGICATGTSLGGGSVGTPRGGNGDNQDSSLTIDRNSHVDTGANMGSTTDPGTGICATGTSLGCASADSDSCLQVHVNKTEFKEQDLLVPWHLKATRKKGVRDQQSVFYRFYHVFQEGELEALVKEVQGVSIQRSYYDQGNWCVIFRKDWG